METSQCVQYLSFAIDRALEPVLETQIAILRDKSLLHRLGTYSQHLRHATRRKGNAPLDAKYEPIKIYNRACAARFGTHGEA